jgi:hypothetical protein
MRTRNTNTRILYVDWTCDSCSTRNHGRDRVCVTCGNPREKVELDKYHSNLSPSGKLDETQKVAPTEVAPVGADWTCKACYAGNKNQDATCVQCGAPRSEKAYEPPPTPVTPEYNPTPVKTVKRTPVRPYQDDTSSYNPPDRTWMIVLAVVAAIVGIVSFLWWGFTDHEEQSVVTSMTWKVEVDQYSWGSTDSGDWERNITWKAPVHPTAGRGSERTGKVKTRCYEKEDRSDSYQCNPHQQCTPQSHQDCRWVSAGTTCRSNGNGTETCSDNQREVCTTVKDADSCTTVYDTCYNQNTYCEYQSWDWKKSQTHVRTGSGYDEVIPEVTDTVSQYHNSPRHSYLLVVAHEERVSEIPTNSRSMYQSYHVGSEIPILVNNFGMVKMK